MGLLLKKILLKCSRPKIWVLFLFLFFAVFLSFPHVAQAGCNWNPKNWGDCVKTPFEGAADILGMLKNLGLIFVTLPMRIAAAFIAEVVSAIALGLGFTFFLVGGLLSSFITQTLSVLVIPGQAGLEWLTTGWTLVRDLVDLFFILALAFIGLATILRLQTYQFQKTLPALIIVALLVNFSGVFVGFIVDISNIVTRFFIDKFAGYNLDNFEAVFTAPANFFLNTILSLFDPLKEQTLTNVFGIIIGSLVFGIAVTLFFGLGVLVLFAVTLLFLMRMIILWVLAVLSPLAFGLYILPATRKFWTQWFQQLIQWSLMGIPIGFFLVLSKIVLNSGGSGGTGGFKVPQLVDPNLGSGLFSFGDIVGNLTTFLQASFSPFLSIVLMGIGVMLSMQMAPSGAKGVINWSKKAGLATYGWAAREGWRKIGRNAEVGAEKTRKKGQEIATTADERLRTEKLNLFQKTGLRFQRFGGRALSTTGTGIEMGSKKLNSYVRGRDEKTIADGEKLAKTEGLNAFNILKLNPLKDWSKMLGVVTGMIKNGKTDDVYKAIENGQISFKDIQGVYKNSVDNGNIDERRLIEKAFIGRALDKKDAQGNIIPNELSVTKKHQEEILERVSPADIEKDIIGTENLFSKRPDGKLEATDTLKELTIKGNPKLTSQILQRGSKKERDAYWQYLKDTGARKLIEMGREDIVRWSTGSAATDLGYGALPIEGGGTEVVTSDIIRELSGVRNISSQDLQAKITGLNARKNELEQQTQLPNRTELIDAQGNRISRGITQEQREAAENELRQVTQDLEKYSREQTRRNREAAQPTETAGDQPISVQIARLKGQEEQLQQQAGTRKRVMGVSIPGTGEAGAGYLPEERAREELKKIQQQREGLEKQLNDLPPELREKEREFERIENEIIENQKKIQDVEKEIATQKQLGAAEQDLGELRNIKEGQERELARLRQEKEERLPAWQAMQKAQELRPERSAGKEVASLRAEERKYASQLAQFRTAKESADKIAQAQELTRRSRNARENAERRLTGIIRTQSLQQRIREIEGWDPLRHPGVTQEKERLLQEVERIKKIEGDFDSIDAEKRRGLIDKPQQSDDEKRQIEEYKKDIAKWQKERDVREQIRKVIQ